MHILLTDFGSAKIISSEDDGGGNGAVEAGGGGRRNSFVGTAQYVSPEILTNSGSSKASDLWALGCIIYQMVTGIPPFQAQNEYLIFQKVPQYPLFHFRRCSESYLSHFRFKIWSTVSMTASTPWLGIWWRSCW